MVEQTQPNHAIRSIITAIELLKSTHEEEIEGEQKGENAVFRKGLLGDF